MDAVRMHAASPESTAIVDAVLDYSRRRMLASDVPLDKPQSEAELNPSGRTHDHRSRDSARRAPSACSSTSSLRPA